MNPLTDIVKLEFHCHTIASRDSLTTPEQLIQACRNKGIDKVVITDHNTIAGGKAAKDLDPDRVIIGEEIMTTKGELLAAFVQEEIPSGLGPIEAIRRLRQQDAFISVSHPFDIHRKGHWYFEDLREIAPLVDAVEIFNARCLQAEFNQRAASFANRFGLPGTAGSDAHAPSELGTATMLLPDFKDAGELKAAMHKVQYEARLSPFWVHFYSRFAVWRKRVFGNPSST